MTPVPSKWPRYVAASIAKNFIVSSLPYQMYLEGSEIDLTTNHYELRTAGPNWNIVGPNQYILDWTINIAVVAQKSNNLYLLEDMIGAILPLFGPIQINMYDVGVTNPGLLTCCRVVGDVKTTRFGEIQISKDPLRVLGATVQASYTGEINNGSY